MKILKATAWKPPPIQAIANTASDPPPSLGVHATFAPDQEYKHHGTLGLPITDTAKSVTGSRDRYGSREFIHFSSGPPKLTRPSIIKVILDNSRISPRNTPNSLSNRHDIRVHSRGQARFVAEHCRELDLLDPSPHARHV